MKATRIKITDQEEERGKKMLLRKEVDVHSNASKKAKKDLETQLKMKAKKSFKSDYEDNVGGLSDEEMMDL